MASSSPDSSTKELDLQREECMPYQIFPDVSEDEEAVPMMHQRGRLPSIVVDPTQAGGEGRGELPWALQRQASMEEEEDSVSQAKILSQGENVEEGGEKRGTQRDADPPGLVDYTRLTPPPSSTPQEVAPLCFRG